MKYLILMLFCSTCYGWGSPDLLPVKERQKEYSIETKLDKNKAFKKIAIWAAKALGDANSAVKLKDAELGSLIAKAIYPCDAMKLGNGFAKNQRIEFTIDITVENKKAEIKFEDIVARGDGYDDASRPSSKKELETAISCVEPVLKDLKSVLE